MPPRSRSSLALAMAVSIAGHAARVEAGEPDVCIAVSEREYGAVADAAERSLGQPVRRIDVRDTGERSTLAAGCERLIIAVGTEALRVSREVAPRSPIVHVMASNGRAIGVPGVSPDADPRHVLEMLRKMAPSARRIGAVFNPELTGELVAEAQASARTLGMELVALPVHNVREAVRAFQRFERELSVEALWLLPDGTATVQETVYYALEIAHWRRMAVIGLSRWYVASGALFALLPKPESCGAAAGELGQQLLRGVALRGSVHARDSVLFLNQRAATRLGLKVPRHVLESAEQVLP